MKSIKEAKSILQLHKQTIEKVSHDKGALLPGMAITAIGGFISAAITLIKVQFPLYDVPPEIAQNVHMSNLILSPLLALISVFLMVVIFLGLMRMFGSKAGFKEIARPALYASLLSWLAVLDLIPGVQNILQFILTAWSFTISVFIVSTVGKLKLGKSVIIVIIPLLFLAILGALALFI